MSTEATLAYHLSFFSDLPATVEQMENKLGLARQEQQQASRKAAEVALAREFYKKAIDIVYESSIGELEKVVNLALDFVFSDAQYKVKFRLDEARGAKNLFIILTDAAYDPPLEVDIKDGVGAGVRTVVSVVLHIFYLINKGAYPMLCVDEAYSALSEEYVERFFTFLRGLCEKKGFHVILISHDPRFLDYADKKYRVKAGVVEDVTNNHD